jgi:hypothetical protein
MPDDGPEVGTGTRASGLMRWGGLALLFLISAVGAAILFRIEIVEAVVRHQIVKAGFPEPEFRIERLDLDGLTVTGISAGDQGSVERLDLDYSLQGLMEGRVERVRIVGLAVDLDRLKIRKTDGGGGAFTLERLPRIDIERASIQSAEGNLRGNARLSPETPDRLGLRLTVMAEEPFGAASLSFEGKLLRHMPDSWALSGRATASADALTSGETSVKGLAADIAVSGTVAGKDASLAFGEPARLSAKSIAYSGEFLAHDLEVSLAGRFSISSGQGAVALNAGKLIAAGATARSASASLPFRFDIDKRRIAIELDERARLSLLGLRVADAASAARFEVSVDGPTALSIPREDARARPAFWHDLSVQVQQLQTVGDPPVTLRPGRVRVSGEVSPELSYRGQINLRNPGVRVGDRAFDIERLRIRMTTGPGLRVPEAHVWGWSLRHTGPGPDIGPVSFRGKVRHSQKFVTFESDIRALGVRDLLKVSGYRDARHGNVRLDLRVPDIRLGPGGLWPTTEFPALRPFTDIAGKIGGGVSLDWQDGVLSGRGTVRVDGVGGRLDDFHAQGIGGTIVFDSLFPPSTDGFQTLRAARIDAGAALTDASVRFALKRSGKLSIDPALAAIAGGRIVFSASDMDVETQTAEASLEIDGVQLGKVPGLTALDEFDASGLVDGKIPVRFNGTETVISGGTLKAREGGVLRLKSESVNRALAGGGRQVGLMLKALENFSYETLSASIDKAPDGKAVVLLQTLGNNPAVADGRKFQINVNLDTNLDKLLAIAADWYRLSGRVLNDIVNRDRPGGNP